MAEDGSAVTNESLLELLNGEYSKHPSATKSYVDLNLRASRWREIEELISYDAWKEKVESVYQKTYEIQKNSVNESTYIQLMSMKAIIICSDNVLAGVA